MQTNTDSPKIEYAPLLKYVKEYTDMSIDDFNKLMYDYTMERLDEFGLFEAINKAVVAKLIDGLS